MKESDALDAICFRPRFSPDHDTKTRTYFGGRPTFAAGMSWPEIAVQGRKFALTFLGQINLADVARVARLESLPDRGILYCFLDTCIIMDGGLEDEKPELGPRWRVLFSGTNAWHFKECGAPKNLMPSFGEASSFATLRDERFRTDEDLKRIRPTIHQMLGHGREVQQRVAQMRTSHIMLMQFDSDKALGWTFGDSGVLQYWISPEDLAASNFDNVMATVAGT
jgi:uncharacterized protein YwqG